MAVAVGVAEAVRVGVGVGVGVRVGTLVATAVLVGIAVVVLVGVGGMEQVPVSPVKLALSVVSVLVAGEEKSVPWGAPQPEVIPR